MSIVLYDLKGRGGRRLSPFGWRVRFALAHKGIVPEDVAVGFTQKDRIAFSGQQLVPVLVDKGKGENGGDRVVFDSWKIAQYLDEAYPQKPLFGAGQAVSLSRFFNNWVGVVVHGGIVSLVMADLFANVGDEDQAYFRESREKRFGKTLEELQKGRDERLPAFRASLDPLRILVKQQPFVCGDAPGFADYMAIGAFQWAKGASDLELLEANDAVAAWRERMLDLYDGLGRRALIGPAE